MLDMLFTVELFSRLLLGDSSNDLNTTLFCSGQGDHLLGFPAKGIMCLRSSFELAPSLLLMWLYILLTL